MSCSKLRTTCTLPEAVLKDYLIIVIDPTLNGSYTFWFLELETHNFADPALVANWFPDTILDLWNSLWLGTKTTYNNQYQPSWSDQKGETTTNLTFSRWEELKWEGSDAVDHPLGRDQTSPLFVNGSKTTAEGIVSVSSPDFMMPCLTFTCIVFTIAFASGWLFYCCYLWSFNVVMLLCMYVLNCLFIVCATHRGSFLMQWNGNVFN